MCCYSKQLRVELDWFRWLYPTKAGSPQSLNRGKGGGGTSGGGEGYTFQKRRKHCVNGKASVATVTNNC
jgi:hypothetical protein